MQSCIPNSLEEYNFEQDLFDQMDYLNGIILKVIKAQRKVIIP